MFAELDLNWLNWSMVAHFSPDSYLLGNITSFLVTLVLAASQSTSLPPFPLSCPWPGPLTSSSVRLSVSALISSHSHLTSPALSISHCLYLFCLPSFHCLPRDIYSWGYLPGRSLMAQIPAFPLSNLPEYSQCYHPGKTSLLYLFYSWAHKENLKWEIINKYMISCSQSTFPRRFSKMQKVDFIIASTPWRVD